MGEHSRRAGICLFRVIIRWIKYHGKTRPDLAEGCVETIDLKFIKWILKFRRNNRSDIGIAAKWIKRGKEKGCIKGNAMGWI